MSRVLNVFVLASWALACACGRTSASPPPAEPAPVAQTPAQPESYEPVQIEMKNVRLHAASGVILDIAALRGEMVSRNPSRPPVFDDEKSYVLRVFSAQIAMDTASLTHLMNDFVFAYEGSPLSKITMEIDEGRLKQKATLHKGVPIPITLKAFVSVTPDGRLRLQTDKVSALGVPAKSLMELFGLKLDDVLSLKNRRGIELDNNDVILSPGLIVPPPEIQGRLTRVSIEGDRLVQTFGSGGAPKALPPPPDRSSRNYIYFSGSVIRFGHLTMNPTELQLIDVDPSDPFDFFPSQYERQLVAGYSKNTAEGGLKTYMPDFGDLARGELAPPKPRTK
jgi:hypothetical protein